MLFSEFKQLVADGNLPAVREALDRDPYLAQVVDPADESWDERTALHVAAKHAHLEVIRLLVERGAEVYSNPLAGYPALFIATYWRHLPDRPNAQHVEDYFLHEVPHLAKGTQKLGATIHIAAREGWYDIVRQHVQLDPLAVHQRGLLGDTPLHWPAHNGFVEIVQLLLDAGADVHAQELGCYGGTPLHWASEHEPAVVRLLLERGADVNSVNQREESDFYGITPLMMNVLMKDDSAEVTRLLIDAGADLAVRYRGKSLLEVAEEKGNNRILAELRRAAL
ncbi:ankyrin repeat domain-containing protein [Aeoliella sp.]|uniref:ankyrin repeat domain-containing protein n=1 Tax=Aeoliella sp. TaxID=2795800 RepID=UPI003CCBFA30